MLENVTHFSNVKKCILHCCRKQQRTTLQGGIALSTPSAVSRIATMRLHSLKVDIGGVINIIITVVITLFIDIILLLIVIIVTYDFIKIQIPYPARI